MELKKLDYAMTVCKIVSESDIELNKEFYFIGRTDEEYSSVCITEDTSANINIVRVCVQHAEIVKGVLQTCR